jgi:hypothetical protein
VGRGRTALVNRSFRLRQLLFQCDVPEGLLVLGEIVADHIPQRLGLLGAEIDALEVADDDLVDILLRHGAEDQEEVPYAHPHLDAVGIAVAVVFGAGELEGWLVGRRVLLAHEVAF